MDEEMDKTFVLPGSLLRSVSDGFQSGEGTYVLEGMIVSTITGFANIPDKGNISITSVNNGVVVPKVGDIVIAKVIKHKLSSVQCQILGLDSIIYYNKQFQGQINHEDLKHVIQVDLDVSDCFHLEDIIMARIIAFGNSQNYILSTVDNGLGVILAFSEHGHRLVPKSWMEMICPRSLNVHKRKVACQSRQFIDKLLTLE